jgi:hypothetical protein
MRSAALDRLARWVEARHECSAVAAFRRVFAGIWVAYDAIDVLWGMTERSRNWFPHPREGGLLALQLVLISTGAMLMLGRGIYASGMIAAAARCLEARFFFTLNDFYFVTVVTLLLAHSDGGPFAARRRGATEPRRAAGAAQRAGPKWVHDVLLAQLAWIYFATASLKLNPDWLGGGHLFVRTQYLTLVGWPYPAMMAHALGNLTVDAALAKAGVLLEMGLAIVLLARRGYWLGVSLAVAVHVVGAVLTNVWFFSASMIAAVVLLLPRDRAPATRSAPAS